MLTSLMLAAQSRLELLVPMLVAGLVVGEWLARIAGFSTLCRRGASYIVTLEHKLNRPQRSAATRVYRGMIALAMLLVPALLTGYLVAHAGGLTPILVPLIVILCIGHTAKPITHLRTWRRAQQGTLTLELPRRDFLFADTHGVLRYTVLTSAEGLAIGVVGCTVWFLLGGVALMLAYLTLASAAGAFHTGAFGWAARSLFHLADAVPRALSALCIWLAAWFIPHTHPLAACRTRHWHPFVATLLGVALGGPMPEGRHVAWVGEGTAKLTDTHLARWLLLALVACILWMGLLAAPTIHNILSYML